MDEPPGNDEASRDLPNTRRAIPKLYPGTRSQPLNRQIPRRPVPSRPGGAGTSGVLSKADVDPFLLFDGYRNNVPRRFLAGVPWHLQPHDRHTGVAWIHSECADRRHQLQSRVYRGLQPAAAAAVNDPHLGVAGEERGVQERGEVVETFMDRPAVQVERRRGCGRLDNGGRLSAGA